MTPEPIWVLCALTMWNQCPPQTMFSVRAPRLLSEMRREKLHQYFFLCRCVRWIHTSSPSFDVCITISKLSTSNWVFISLNNWGTVFDGRTINVIFLTVASGIKFEMMHCTLPSSPQTISMKRRKEYFEKNINWMGLNQLEFHRSPSPSNQIIEFLFWPLENIYSAHAALNPPSFAI